MQKIFFLFATILVLSSCSSSKKTAGSNSVSKSSESISEGVNGAGYGLSFENPVLINKKHEGEGVKEEYNWLAKNYPGYKMIEQSLDHRNGKSYDILKIKTSDGEEKSIYFDISKFFGKF